MILVKTLLVLVLDKTSELSVNPETPLVLVKEPVVTTGTRNKKKIDPKFINLVETNYGRPCTTLYHVNAIYSWNCGLSQELNEARTT